MQLYPFSVQPNEYDSLMNMLDVSTAGIQLMKDRFDMQSFFISNVSSPGANALKQHVLSLGGEAAVPRQTITCAKEKSDLIFSLRKDKIPQLLSRLKIQCWKLDKVAEMIQKYNEIEDRWGRFSLRGKKFYRPVVMGILNMTPDSFSDGGKYFDEQNALNHISKMVDEGAGIIDVGGESTRPGAQKVSVEEEIRRTASVIKAAAQEYKKIPISIDTMKSNVAKKAVEAGASIINDVSGLKNDQEIANIAAMNDCAIVIMHMKGTPDSMQKNPTYMNICAEINEFFDMAIETALKAGVKEESIILDPGIGFGKTVDHNLFIIKHLEAFQLRRMPLLIGASRKSVIGKITGREIASERLAGTIALHQMALERGAAIIRAHDVRAAVDAISMYNAVVGAACF